jgi:hypothetical protein
MEINRSVGVFARKEELTSKVQFCDTCTVFIIIIMSDAKIGILTRSLYEVNGQFRFKIILLFGKNAYLYRCKTTGEEKKETDDRRRWN